MNGKRWVKSFALPVISRTPAGPRRARMRKLSTAPLYAQREQQNVTKLKADARNVVGTIANDKAKTQTYCQIVDLAHQLAQAAQEKDRKKAKTLVERIDQLQKQLAEFVALSNIVKQVDLNSPDRREIALIIQSLDQSCPD